jgi:hypothetical protein
MPANLNKYEMSTKMAEQINRSFIYHEPKDDQPERYVYLREQARFLAQAIACMVPPGREQSSAITKLEECIMWANKGIACGE